MDFRGQAAVVFETGGGVGHVELAFDDGFAAVKRFEFGEVGGVFANNVGHLEEDAAAHLGLR